MRLRLTNLASLPGFFHSDRLMLGAPPFLLQRVSEEYATLLEMTPLVRLYARVVVFCGATIENLPRSCVDPAPVTRVGPSGWADHVWARGKT